MYKIIGADGREYGPIGADQVRQWITEGRANAQTGAQQEGSAQWKTLGEFPEFADLFAGPRVGPAAMPPPLSGPSNPEALAAEILARGYTVEISSCISRAWQLVWSNFWSLVGTTFLGLIVAGGAGIPFAGIIVGGPMMGGLYAFYLKRIRGQPASVGDAFVGFSAAFVPLMLAHIVSSLLTALALCLCVLPGIYLAVAWVFTFQLIIDKKLEFWAAMEVSRKVVTQHWWAMFGLMLLAGLICIAGVLACVVGVFVTSAVALVALNYAYEDIFGARTTPAA